MQNADQDQVIIERNSYVASLKDRKSFSKTIILKLIQPTEKYTRLSDNVILKVVN